MKEKPILFSTEMVQAILHGEKTQTRRVIKNVWDVMKENSKDDRLYAWRFKYYKGSTTDGDPVKIICPYGKIGDQLWVRETFGIRPDYNEPRYRADCGMDREAVGGKWKPSIHMPRKHARIWLEIVNIRVERVQDITNRDIEAEGACKRSCVTHQLNFQVLWDSINKKRGYGWNENPWVWVIEFKIIKN